MNLGTHQRSINTLHKHFLTECDEKRAVMKIL